VIKRHAAIGAEMLAGREFPLLEMAERIALTHHERWDGSGYPAGLASEEIPLVGRIVALADVFDALTHTTAPTNRPGPSTTRAPRSAPNAAASRPRAGGRLPRTRRRRRPFHDRHPALPWRPGLAGERDGIVSDMRMTIAARFLAVLAVGGLLRRESG
jgi:hypothetical protein